MRIAYVSADSGVPVFGSKGASVHLRELVGALVASGHQVTILAAKRGEVASPLGAEVVTVKGHDEALGSPGAAIPEAKPESALARELRALRVGVAMLGQLRALYARQGFEMVYERYSLWSAAAVRAAQELNVPSLVEVNAPLLQEQRRYRGLILASVAEAIEGEVFGRADALLAVSEGVKAYALARGASPGRTLVLPNAVDVSRFHPGVPAEPVEGIDRKFVVGFVGSLKEWHGIEVLLQAFRKLRDRATDYHLLLVGDGPLRSWIESFIEASALEGMITMTGAVLHERVPRLIQRMDVAVAPYPLLEDFYFSPLKLFEYMAVGKPVVASRIGQIQEVIQEGATGLLVDPGDAEDLADKIERLRSDRSLRVALGAAAAHRVRHHTWERVAQKVIAITQEVLGKRCATASG